MACRYASVLLLLLAVVMASLADLRETVDEYIINQVDPNNIRDNLRYLTRRPHLAGTEAELENAMWVADRWREQGWDQVHLVPYQVLLSYPKNDTPNLVSVLDELGGEVWTSQGWQEPLYAPEEFSLEVLPNFNAFSAQGQVEGDVVYANFGRKDDFELLESLGVQVEGRIVLARYGEIFRANIADMAERQGALGLVLYSDPQQYAPLGEEQVYPNTVYLPPTGAAAGTVYLDDGDPLTRFYPAIESAYRIPESEARLPRIPITPISYSDASQILSRMGGAEAPVEWQGGLNLTYNLGPGLNSAGWKVKMDVHTSNTPTTIYNVVAMMQGSEEPDRYVILGNHRDAWNFGGLDPNSGTAALLEVSRVLTKLRNDTGWSPRRSVVMCSWAAEEYGLIGSMEWVEQFGTQLMDRGVAYLNVDMGIEGNVTLRAKSAPLLNSAIFQAAAKIPNPNPDEITAGRPTVYDTWAYWKPDPTHPGRPSVLTLGGGSDFLGFQNKFGVPCLDIRYTHGPDMYKEPLYHTLYETFELVDELFDRGFYYHAAITQMWAVLAVDFADSKVLPFSLDEYSSFLSDAHADFVEHYSDLIATRNISLDYFSAAIDQFSQATANFTSSLPPEELAGELEARRINDQMMMVERAFLDRQGLPRRPDYNHVVEAPSSSDGYASNAFAGLTDALDGIESLSPGEQEDRWREFSQHLAAVTHFLGVAAKVLTLNLW